MARKLLLAAALVTVSMAGTARAASADALTPADPYFSLAWEMQGDAPMGVASAWQRTTGGPVTVAVIDTGTDLGHPDLAPNLWTNPGEIPANGRDDDRNGYVDDFHGWDFVSADGDPSDDNGHGTHVAGIIGAQGGNGIGTAGVAWTARMMTVKVLDHRGRGNARNIARGLRYAVANGARIINLSSAVPTRDRRLKSAIAKAASSGALIIAAAGNWGSNVARLASYPTSFGAANVISVAATARDGALLTNSNYGRRVDLAAPGDDIVSTALGGGYEMRSGTSMAAPLVTGVAVLLAATRPTATWRMIRRALLTGARRTTLPVRSGALDAAGALRTLG